MGEAKSADEDLNVARYVTNVTDGIRPRTVVALLAHDLEGSVGTMIINYAY